MPHSKTRTSLHLLLAAAVAAAAAGALNARASVPQEAEPVPLFVQQMARDIAGELAANCPLAPAGDVNAYNACRKALFADSTLRSHLAPFILWGRQHKDPNASLRQTHLTQFAPDVWTSMYAPMFMFNGKHTVRWVPEEKRYLVRLEAAFRNRLPPGQFPYPLWHEENKWATYEKANGFMLWIDPNAARIQAVQFTDRAPNAMLQPVQHVRHEFDGRWMWTDERGNTQPAVTVFDGLYRADNPYIKQMDRQYKELAAQMREAQCTNCHVPNNPDKMSRLVLLSTPVHAAGEIERLIKAVKEDKMPMDDFRVSYALEPDVKKWLLDRAETFRATVMAAQAWERQARKAEATRMAGARGQVSSLGWQPAGPSSLQPAEVTK